jgi:hypothetical protein
MSTPRRKTVFLFGKKPPSYPGVVLLVGMRAAAADIVLTITDVSNNPAVSQRACALSTVAKYA